MRLTKKQFKAVKSFITKECTNYMQGECLPLDIKCPQMNCKTGLCKYFKKSVLPLDEYLYSEVVKDGQSFTKRCEICGCIFNSAAKNTRFCEQCAKKQRRITFRNSKRRIRAHMSTK